MKQVPLLSTENASKVTETSLPLISQASFHRLVQKILTFALSSVALSLFFIHYSPCLFFQILGVPFPSYIFEKLFDGSDEL
mmetsp:Transcript_54306/g.62208  ORF Transcript_54306/g.62208 Transcript_54306/m.62208 type:complete len:81 (-) Transcript_54306:351-593(-)